MNEDDAIRTHLEQLGLQLVPASGTGKCLVGDCARDVGLLGISMDILQEGSARELLHQLHDGFLEPSVSVYYRSAVAES